MAHRAAPTTTWASIVAYFLFVVYHSRTGAVGATTDGSMVADDLIQPAVSWLLERAKASAGWGADTPRALLALSRLSPSSSADASSWNPDSEHALLLRRQFDIQLLVFLLKNHHHGSNRHNNQHEHVTPNTMEPSASLFALTLASSCRNPRDFYEQDLVAPILASEDDDGRTSPPQQPFTYAFNTLAICAGGGHLKRRHVVKLLEIVSQPSGQLHSIDVLSMVSMATWCLSRSSTKYRHLTDYLEQPLKLIAAQQQPDGSFDHNVPTTALAIQALQIPDTMDSSSKMISLPAWRPDAALDWLRNLQRPDGSFGDLFTTTEVLIALSPRRGYAAINFTDCPARSSNKSEDMDGLATTTYSPLTTSTIPSAGPSGGDPSKMIRFTYVIWIGQNRSEVHAIQLTIPVNTSFYEAMKLAAEADQHFEFSASVWPNGHYVHTINGHRDQYIGFHFWLLFRLPFMPDPSNPPPTTYVAPAGVDDMYPQNGEYYMFWYKDV